MEVAADDAVGDGFGVDAVDAADAVVDADADFDAVVVVAAAAGVDALSSR